MPDSKPVVCVKKEGNVCTLYFGGLGGSPLPFERFDEEPGMPQTMSYSELKARYGHLNLKFIERPAPAPKKHIPKTAKELAAIDTRISQFTGKVVRRDISVTEPLATEFPAETPDSPKPQPPGKTLGFFRALGFLKMLKIAMRYATPANQTILSTKIETVEELMEEVWNVPRQTRQKETDGQITVAEDQIRRDQAASLQRLEATTAEKIRDGTGNLS